MISTSKDGDITLESYGPGATVEAIPQYHCEFLESYVPYYETDHFVFPHANYSWYSNLPYQPTSLFRWTAIEEEPPKQHVSGKTFIVGHSPGQIRDLGYCRCRDTGFSIGDILTAMEVNTRKIWQVTESGMPVANDS
ncbi:hypothetical protein AB1K70_11835 [Bremerella sp. JC770]|uniref:hypothetical protein n=1 Tax=Bremerella sp. JC770 TaxID=3232137 RepID=UPI0034585C15